MSPSEGSDDGPDSHSSEEGEESLDDEEPTIVDGFKIVDWDGEGRDPASLIGRRIMPYPDTGQYYNTTDDGELYGPDRIEFLVTRSESGHQTEEIQIMRPGDGEKYMANLRDNIRSDSPETFGDLIKCHDLVGFLTQLSDAEHEGGILIEDAVLAESNVGNKSKVIGLKLEGMKEFDVDECGDDWSEPIEYEPEFFWISCSERVYGSGDDDDLGFDYVPKSLRGYSSSPEADVVSYYGVQIMEEYVDYDNHWYRVASGRRYA